jgi:hypothetical protein
VQRVDRLDQVDVLALSMALFDDAKHALYWSVGLGVLATVLSLLGSIWTDVWNPSLWLGLGSAIAVTLSYAQFRRYDIRYSLSSQAKRLELLVRGLDWVCPQTIRTKLLQEAGARTRRKSDSYRAEATAYYDTAKQFGPGRLLDMVQESAMFTAALYRALRGWLIWATAVTAGVTLLSGWLLLVIDVPSDLRTRFGQLAVAIVPALITLGLLAWIFKLGDLATAIEDIDAEFECLRARGAPDLIDVLQLTQEYTAQIAQGIVIPGWLWERQRPELNALWAERRRQKQTT